MSPQREIIYLSVYWFKDSKTSLEGGGKKKLALGRSKSCGTGFVLRFFILNYYDHDYYYNIIDNYLFFLYGFQVE